MSGGRLAPLPLRTAGRLLGAVVGAVVAAAIAALVLAFLVVPKVMGWVPLAVLSGSMRPVLQPGAEIVVRPVTSEAQLARITIGQVITFLPFPDDPTLVTHRVVGVEHGSDGSVTFTTKGDDNNAPDPNPVRGKQVRGVLLYHVPLLGRLTTALPHGGKEWGIALVAIALLGYGAWQVAAAARSRGNVRRRGRHRETADHREVT